MSTTSYIFPQRVKDRYQARDFLVANGNVVENVIIDESNGNIIILTNESSVNESTRTALQNILQKYPDTETNNDIARRPSGYFPTQVYMMEPDTVLSTNTTLTKNMHYSNLTIDAGVTLNSSGWRIIVTGELILNGTIAFNGADATTKGPGINPVQPYTTFLGPGLNGVAGISQSGVGKAGLTTNYACTGGVGGSAGHGLFYQGGSGGTVNSISPVEGGLQSLSMMPLAISGRTVSGGYLVGATGGGSGGLYKGNTNAISGAGGAGAGVIIVVASSIVGNGSIQARGGAGASGSYTSGNSGAVGAGGGGGGGMVILVSQSQIPPTISIDVSGGAGAKGLLSGGDSQAGDPGNIFRVYV